MPDIHCLSYSFQRVECCESSPRGLGSGYEWLDVCRIMWLRDQEALGPHDEEVIHIRAVMATDFHRQSAITHGYSKRPCISDKDMILLIC